MGKGEKSRKKPAENKNSPRLRDSVSLRRGRPDKRTREREYLRNWGRKKIPERRIAKRRSERRRGNLPNHAISKKLLPVP